jgi:hypothetical protein
MSWQSHYSAFSIAGVYFCDPLGQESVRTKATALSLVFVRTEIPASGLEPETSGLGNQRSIQLSYAGERINAIRANEMDQAKKMAIVGRTNFCQD